MVNDLIPVFGEPFLRYVLAYDGEALTADGLDDRQRVVVDKLRERAFGAAPGEDQFDQFSRLASLGQWIEDARTSLPNVLRVYCGGGLPPCPQTDEPILEALQELARDAWPTLLLPPPKQGVPTFWSSMPLVTLSHPAAISAARAFLADDALRRLFPHAPSPANADKAALLALSSYWINGLGGGMMHHELLPLTGILVTGARLWGLVENGEDTWQSLLDSLPEMLAATRQLALGETVEVPRLVGFRGPSTDGETIVDLPSGTLCAPRRIDKEFLLSNVEDVSLVSISRYPLRLVGVQPRQEGDEMPDLAASWKSLQDDQSRSEREADLTRLAVLLASEEGQAWGLTEIASLVVDPTAAGGAAWGGTHERRGLIPGGRIDLDVAKRIKDWRATLQRKFPASLDIAMRRSLSAAGYRGDPLDGFVDAVIAWENCFGTRQETSFRVTGGIAALLEPSSRHRVECQKKLRKMYDKRSEVVHGVAHLSASEAIALRDEAVQIAIRCLRSLLIDRPDLLDLKSELRSTELMLGGASSTD